MLSWHRQGGDEHGDTAQHENGSHEAAHAPQEDGSASCEVQLHRTAGNHQSDSKVKV